MGHIRSAVIFATLAGLSACTLTQTLVHNFADLDDYRIFANREVSNAVEQSSLRALRQEPKFLTALQVPGETGAAWRLDDYLEHTRTAAFIVLHEDRVVLPKFDSFSHFSW